MKKILILAASVAFLAACADRGGDEAGPAAAVPDSEAAARVATRLIPREVIFGNPDRTQARISPDGKHLSWLAPQGGVMNIWVAPAADLSSAKVITSDTYRGIQQHFWAPNGQFVFYLQDQGGDENFHVSSVDIDTGEVVDLTPVGDGV